MLLIITPTYNEKNNIEALIEKIKNSVDAHLLVIDDNSPDGTGQLLEKLKNEKLKVIHRPKKLGLGTAYIEGFKYAIQNNYDFVIIMDADLSHNPEYLPEFLEKLRLCDLVIGSRYIPGGGVIGWPLNRKLLSFLGNLYAKIITGLPIHDCTSGFMGFKREVIKYLLNENIKTEGYSFLIELKYRSFKNNYKICEIPIIFTDRIAGKSKISKKIIFEAYSLSGNLDMKRNSIILLLIIFLGVCLRLININSPLTDWHSWRQTFSAMISRNFYENGYKILYPQIDYNGKSPGYVPLEFPIYQFIVALLYKLFGFQEWLGKLISIIFSIGTMLLLFFLTRIYFGEKVALYSVSVFAFLPLSIFYSQTFMPESMLIFCSMASVYFLNKWLDTSKITFFILGIIFTVFAFLVKITSLYLILPILYLFWCKYSKEIIKKTNFWIFIILSLLPSFLWYILWTPKISFEGIFGSIWDTKDRWGNFNWWLNINWYQKIFLQHISENWLLFIGIVFFILGFFQKTKNKNEYVFHIWTFGIISYFFIVAQGNWVHEYYQFPFVLPASIFIAKSLNSIFESKNKKIKIIIIFLLISFIPVGRYKLLKRTKRNDAYYHAGITINKITPKNSLLLVSDYDKPEVLYYSHRKGWHITPDDQNKETIENFIDQGANYFVTTEIKKFYSNKSFCEYIFENYKLLKEEKNKYVIFELTKK